MRPFLYIKQYEEYLNTPCRKTKYNNFKFRYLQHGKDLQKTIEFFSKPIIYKNNFKSRTGIYKLTKEQIQDIKTQYNDFKISTKSLAYHYGVAQKSIYRYLLYNL